MTTLVSWYQNVSILDFIGAKNDYGGGGDSSAAAIRHAKPSQIATIDKPTRSHLQAG